MMEVGEDVRRPSSEGRKIHGSGRGMILFFMVLFHAEVYERIDEIRFRRDVAAERLYTSDVLFFMVLYRKNLENSQGLKEKNPKKVHGRGEMTIFDVKSACWLTERGTFDNNLVIGCSIDIKRGDSQR